MCACGDGRCPEIRKSNRIIPGRLCCVKADRRRTASDDVVVAAAAAAAVDGDNDLRWQRNQIRLRRRHAE